MLALPMLAALALPLATESEQVAPVQILMSLEVKGFSHDGFLAISPNGKLVVASNNQGACRLWDVATEKLIAEVGGENEPVGPACYIDNDRCFAWTLRRGKGFRNLHHDLLILSGPVLKEVERFSDRGIIALSPVGTTALCSTFDPEQIGPALTPSGYELWDWKTNKTLHTLKLDPGTRIDMANFRADGKHLATTIVRARQARFDKERPPLLPPYVLLWDTATGKEVDKIELLPKGAKVPFGGVAISPDGQTVAIAGGDSYGGGERPPDSIWFWDAKTRESRFPFRFPDPIYGGPTHGLHYRPEGRFLVAAAPAGVVLWDVQGKKTYEAEEGLRRLGKMARVSFSPDGMYVATMNGARLQVWKVTLPKAEK